MFDYDKLYTLADGEPKLKYLKKGIDEAQKAKDYETALELMREYIKQSVFNDDNFKALIMFPEYMALYDANPELQDPYSFMFAFKWIIEDITDFYQISIEKAEEYFSEFKKRCQQYGYSLRTYYMKKMYFYSQIDFNKVIEYQKKFRESKRDSLSDCHACEMNLDICTELEFGSDQKAMQMLKNMMNKGISCGEVPQVTYGKCIHHFIKTGNLQEAEYYAEKLMPMIKNNDNFLMEVAHILLLKAYTNPNDALKIFENYLESFMKNKNPKMRFYFADASARFFGNIADNDISTIIMKLPHTFTLYHKEDEYTVAELQTYFFNLAKVIAEKFDERNKNSYYTDILNYEYPAEPISNLELPKHSTVSRKPASIAVAFRSEDVVPSPDEIFQSLQEKFEIEHMFFDDENKVLTAEMRYNQTDEKAVVKINISDAEDFALMKPVHQISQEEFERFVDDYKLMLVISTIYNNEWENVEFNNLLKIADIFNTDDSPVVINLSHGILLSSKWVKFQSECDTPPLEYYMYRVHAYPCEDDETRFEIITTGLAEYGSRELCVLNVEEKDIYFANRIVSQIAESICNVELMRDEGDISSFGTTFNNESEVLFSWLSPKTAHPNHEDSDFFAVPVIYLSANDARNGNGLLINDIPDELKDKFDFRTTNRHISIEENIANNRFSYALEKFRNTENSKLIIGCYVNIPEEFQDKYGEDYMCYVQAEYVEENIEDIKIKGTIVDGVDEIEDFCTGSTLSVPPESIFFWRLEIDNKYYFADDSYLLI